MAIMPTPCPGWVVPAPGPGGAGLRSRPVMAWSALHTTYPTGVQ
uniref:Uncharacterized protein n=1 Tax=Verrucosispora sp. MS100047 TaxID=1410949 RepID=A0A097CRX6_9ACTN|nr:hypothetical protein VASRM7_165 [Verrucosispora sp. MS100047]